MTFDVPRLRREEFPWADAGTEIYLNAASTGPLPERSVRAQTEMTRRRATPWRVTQQDQFGTLDRARELVAQLIGAAVEEVALGVNTSTGINLAAWALPLRKGDVVVVPDREFPANMYPWMAAAEARGFTVRRVPARNGLLDEAAMLDALDAPGVRVLALSWVGFATGVVADLERLGDACRQRGVHFVVDGIQGLGALTFDVRRAHIDIMACGAQKWLLGPWGSGFTYVRRDLVHGLAPQPVSWMSVAGSDDLSRLLEYHLIWRDDARRFEQITLPYQDFAGMVASLELLHELGPAEVAAHIQARTRELLDGAASLGIPLVTPHDRVAGIACVRPPEAAAASERLDAAGIAHSLREGTIRLSPHCYTTSGEVQTTIAALARATRLA